MMSVAGRHVLSGRSYLAGLAVLLLAKAALAQQASGSDPAFVETETGTVRGVIHDGLREFKGIPYAAPPVGTLRWSMPQPAKAWTGVLDATKYSTPCPQVARYGIPEASEDEDCLYLNVTAPYSESPERERKRPVIVWIHGGAFVGGSSALYPLGFMAKAGDAVVVSLNYRLGVFGFMAHPAFEPGHNGGYGLEDQRLALRWVKKNIAAFGGDPDNVTLAGESAGAGSTCMHIIAPKETTGLFDKAIVQSGGCAQRLHTVAEGNQFGLKVAALTGCSDAAAALSCLRDKPAKELLEAASKGAGGDLTVFMPVIGAETVPLQGAEALKTGQFVRVPVINGGDRDEIRLYVAYGIQAGASFDKENYPEKLRMIYAANADAVAKEYPLRSYSSPATALGTALSDFNPQLGINNCIFLEAGKLLAKWVPVYEYVFADRNAPAVTDNPGMEMGAVHSSELPYQFPHFSNTRAIDGPGLAPASQKLAEQMMAYWVSFARTGRPAAPDAPLWEPFTADGKVMLFEPDKVREFDASAAHKCGFWKTLYPKLLTQ